MEKKVPERKVCLRGEDVFYIYDKRINKCAKEGCTGIVKYGLVLRVSVSETESFNCFECNKCHMKYSPYPNYVRLSKTDMLHIYNQEEVTARDEKRAEDARKQQKRERRNNKPAFPGEKAFKPRKPYHKDKFDKEGKTFRKRFEEGSEKSRYGNVIIATGNYKKRNDRPQRDGVKNRYDDTGKRV